MTPQLSTLLRAIADGTTVQMRTPNSLWITLSPSAAVLEVARAMDAEHCASLRVKPAFIIVNGVEVPMHEVSTPALGTKYWLVSIATPSAPVPESWTGHKADFSRLEAGRVYLNRDHAVARGEAMMQWETA